MDPIVWNVDRAIINLGFFELRYYSVLFAGSIFLGYLLLKRFMVKEGKDPMLMDSLLTYVVVGTIAGARLAHCLFYEPAVYLNDPIRILKVWEGGLASHGGYLGVIIGLILFCWKHHEIAFFWLADRVAIPAMFCGGCIRVGNLFNSEILGKATDVPWAFVFAKYDQVPRHPTPIYEALGYFTIFLILYGYYRLQNRQVLEGRLLGMVLILGYSFRIFVEQFKMVQETFEMTLPLNMGQLLSVPFILIGIYFTLGLHHKVPFFQRGLSGK